MRRVGGRRSEYTADGLCARGFVVPSGLLTPLPCHPGGRIVPSGVAVGMGSAGAARLQRPGLPTPRPMDP